MPEYIILTPVLHKYLKMSKEEVDALKGMRRTQYRYRLKTRINQAFEDLDTIIEHRPKDLSIDLILLLLQNRLRKSFLNEDISIHIGTRKRKDFD